MYIGRCWGYLGVQVLMVCLSNDIPNSEAFFPCIHLPLGFHLLLISWFAQLSNLGLWKVWSGKHGRKKVTFKSTMMSFSVFLVFMLPDFICSYSILFSPIGFLAVYTLYIFMYYGQLKIKSILPYLVRVYLKVVRCVCNIIHKHHSNIFF